LLWLSPCYFVFHWHVIHEDIYQKLGNLCQQGNETACFISNVCATTKYWLRVLAPCSMQGPSLPARNCIRKKIEKYLSFKGRPAACKRRLWEGCQVRHRLTLILTNYMFRERNGAELNKQRNVYNRLKASVQISNIYSCSDKLLFSFFVVLELFPMSTIEKQL